MGYSDSVLDVYRGLIGLEWRIVIGKADVDRDKRTSSYPFRSKLSRDVR